MEGADRLSALFGRRRFSIRPGLERINALLDRLGHPEQSFKSIHVAGTNGKGSTASFIASMLEQAGFKTGLFTSPHLISYRERFQVNGTEIDQETLDSLTAKLLATASEEDTFFEITTALACQHFSDCGVQVAVLEAGMGGRSDATAAIPGILTVITPVELDHCQWLGNSLHEIAAEKVAIAGHGSPVVTATQPAEAMAAIMDYCNANGCSLTVSPPAVSGLTLGIPGSYQRGNASVALTAMEILSEAGLCSSRLQREAGLAKASWPGRMELFTLPDGSQILLDGAHNPAGVAALADALLDQYPDRRIILVLGMMEDKETGLMVEKLACLPELVITVRPDQERGLSTSALAELCRMYGLNAIESDSVASGLSAAVQAAVAEKQLIVVAGSLFTVGEARAILTDKTCEAVRG